MDRDPSMSAIILEVFPLIKRRLLRFDDNAGGGTLSPIHIQILSRLNHEGTQTVSELGRELMIAKPNMTPPLRKLAEDGLIARDSDRYDRRIVNVSITDTGRGYLDEYCERVSEYIMEKLPLLSGENLYEFTNALIMVKKVLDKIS